MDIGEHVYDTLLNSSAEGYEVPWVKPIFITGHPCFESYCDMHKAYAQLRLRLGVADEDMDIERIIDDLLEHGRVLALEMFRYGMLYQQMQDAEKPGA